MSDNENETYKPDVDKQDGGPGAQTGGDGGEYDDVASGGQSDAADDEGQHGDADDA